MEDYFPLPTRGFQVPWLVFQGILYTLPDIFFGLIPLTDHLNYTGNLEPENHWVVEENRLPKVHVHPFSGSFFPGVHVVFPSNAVHLKDYFQRPQMNEIFARKTDELRRQSVPESIEAVNNEAERGLFRFGAKNG